MSERVLLTAANGRTGRPILQALVAKGLQVRVYIRDQQQWSALQALGAESFAVGDLEDTAALRQAMQGCQRLIHIGPPMHPREYEISEQLIALAKEQALKHFIYYSVMHPLRREVRHHRLKLDVEETLIESGLAYTIIQPIRYMQHLAPIWPAVLEQGVHAMPFNTEVAFNVVDLQDLAEATAIVASSEQHYYATYELAGPEPLNQQQMAAIISEEIGRPVEARQVTLEQVAEKARSKGLDEDRVEQMVIMNRHYDQHGFRGNPNVLRWLLGREPGSFREYVRRLQQG